MKQVVGSRTSAKHFFRSLSFSVSALFSLTALSGESDSPIEEPEAERRWGVQVGAAVITQNNIGQILTGTIDSAEGAAEGELYNLTLTYRAYRFHIPFRGGELTPTVEPYATFTLVNERDDTFPDYNLGVGFRWVDFPWNRWLQTTFFTGVGLSYSAHVLQDDRQRHPGDRSHLKFDWPLQLTFALPRWPEHQLVLFNDHQSGGHIFDEGGVNSLGVGYRYEF